MVAIVFGQVRVCPTCAGCGYLRRVRVNGSDRYGRLGVMAAQKLAAGKHLPNLVPCFDTRCHGGLIPNGR